MSQRIFDDDPRNGMFADVPVQPNLSVVPDLAPDDCAELAGRKPLGWYGKLGVRSAGALLAIGAPLANGANHVVSESPTHVPVHIAGSDVTVEMQPGSNVANITALGQKFTNYSHSKLGRKDIGYNVDVDTTNVTKADPSFSLSSESIQNIFRQFTDLTAQKHEVMDAVRKHSEHQFAIGAGEAVAAEIAAFGLFLYVRRLGKNISHDEKELAGAAMLLDKLKKPVAGAAMLAAVVPIGQLSYTYFSPNVPQTVEADPAMAGTPLEGFEVNGVVKQAIDTAVPNIRQFIQNTNEYYGNATANFSKEFKNVYGVNVLPKENGVYRVIVADDFQGIKMGGLVGQAAHAFNADAEEVGGDINETGTIEETDVADTLKDSSRGIPVLWVRGHHDDDNTVQMMKERGFTEANGTIQKVGPLTFYGVNDAETIDGLGLPAHEITPGVDNAQLTRKAIDYLCSDAVQKLEKKPIFISHDRAIGDAVAATGCVPSVLTGREYFEQPPVNYGGRTDEIISGSSGGHIAKEGLHLLGTPKSDAVFHVVDFDAKTQRILDYRVITVSSEPSAEVTFGPKIDFAEVPEQKLSPAYRNNYLAENDKSHRQLEASRSQSRHRGTSRQSKTR